MGSGREVWASPLTLSLILGRLQGSATEGILSKVQLRDGNPQPLWQRSHNQQCDPRKSAKFWQKVMRLRAKLCFSPRRQGRKSRNSASRGGEWTRSEVPRDKVKNPCNWSWGQRQLRRHGQSKFGDRATDCDLSECLGLKWVWSCHTGPVWNTTRW